ncbi:MAG: ATP-binding cassette domain-containing protein [Candidatus Dojkabacteria bacterium]|jgi:ABC-2 type transport system ATP-binding protein|nr:ATP-binding cassette domain-containing protein [Candidatus Dojkabacteria bacterium]
MANYSIHIKNFSKSFGDLKAVDNLSFDVNEGEIFAFLGANGSGKTTTIRCLLKIYQPDEGELLINNSEYNEDFNNLIGYLPEERGLYRDVSVLDILVYTAVLRNIKKEEALSRSIEYLKKVDLYDHRDKEIAKLSSGMQQKVQLGTALIHEPEILILDEPFKGLDPVNRQLFVDILIERAKNGTTILYSTHVIDEAQKMADTLLIIKNGKSLEYGNVEKVREKYGSKNIIIDFVGKAPEKDNRLYSAIISNKRAEISPKSNIDSNEIIKNILNQGVKIVDMTLDYPSLNQIFIELMKK